MTPALSLTGLVFGMHATAVKPPATAAAAPGRHGFLVLSARLAQVHVHVDEAGAHDNPPARRRPGAVGVEVLADVGDAIAVDQDVEDAVAPLAGSTTRPP